MTCGRALAALGALVLAACGAPGGAADTRATVRPDVRFQTIVGWEVTAEMGDRPGEGDPQLFAELIERAVNEVGVTRLRLEVRSGAEKPDSGFRDYAAGRLSEDQWRAVRYVTANDNDDPDTINPDGFDFSELDYQVEVAVLPVKAALEARGESLFINVCYVAFTRQNAPGAQYHHNDPAEYAEFVLAVHQHLDAKYGLRPDTWEVILEPDTAGAAQRWDGFQIGRLIAATRPRLDAAGFSTRFVAPSTTNMSNAPSFFDDMLSVLTPADADRIAELSYHRYAGVNGRALRAIAQRRREHGVQTGMLELWFGRGDHHVLHEDLKVGEVSAWQGRVLRGLFDVETGPDGSSRVSLREDIRHNRQYFHYVRPGAVRIGVDVARSPFGGPFDPLAFINPDGGYVVVANAARGGELAVEGLPAGRYRASYATGAGSGALDEPLIVEEGEPAVASIPAAGVLTIYPE